MMFVFAGLLAAFAGTDFFPGFYGDYRITNWVCESSIADRGCHESARIVIEPSASVSAISVYNSAGVRIRWNELIEKNDAKNSAVLSGDADFAAYTVEAKANNGGRYFYNFLEVRRLRDATLEFTHISEQTLGGVKNRIKRVFTLALKGPPMLHGLMLSKFID